MKYLLLLFVSLPTLMFSQPWTWTEISQMPEPVSNNAVTEAFVNGVPYVYSFSGIDSTKLWSGIHLRGFRYNTQADIWDTIPSLPDNMGKIAAGASTVNNKIYIIGGYHVLQNGNEVSSDKVHIFDPVTNNYLPDGAPIPVAIDDHVQAVWKDSLIYVVTGWSNNQNVTNVQIYNPSTDTWMVGTPISTSSNYRVFGGSGTIIGDTLYYIGGARYGSNFPPSIYIRKGYIDPNNPTNITWSLEADALSRGYRMAAIEMDGKAHWVGGSFQTYNYNGIAYNGSGGVPAMDRIVTYNPTKGSLSSIIGEIPAVMDLRGIAKISFDECIIAGGMMGNQAVTDRAFRLTLVPTSIRDIVVENDVLLFPNPANAYFQIKGNYHGRVMVFNELGQVVFEKTIVEGERISTQNWLSGIYEVLLFDKNEMVKGRVVIR